jgi:cytochrome P450
VREAREDTELGGVLVPAGSVVNVATYAIHRDPAYWPQAEEFMPERWLKVGGQLLL